MRFVPGPGQVPWSPAGTWRVLPTPTELAAPANPRAISTRGTRAFISPFPYATKTMSGTHEKRWSTH